MMTIEECAIRLAAVTGGPDLITKVDKVVDCYLVQFRGDANEIGRQRDALITAVQKVANFTTKGRVLERLRTGPTSS